MKKARDLNMREKPCVSKISAVFFLIVSIIFLLPSIVLGIVLIFMALLSSAFVVMLFLFIFIMPFVVALVKVVSSCMCVILSDRKISVSEFNDMLILFNKQKVKKDINTDGVAGIVQGREFESIDKNDDGIILISEFYPLTEKEVLEKVLEVDENFSKVEFKSYVKSLFMLIQKAFSNNDYFMLRAFETDSLYYRHKIEIENLIKQNIVEQRKNIVIKGALLKDFKVDGNKEIMVVALTAKMVIDCNSSLVTNVNDTYSYIMTFARNKGVKTKTGISLSTSNCCNCGAVIDVDDDGVCNYCNTSIVSGELDWVLIDIKNIKLAE